MKYQFFGLISILALGLTSCSLSEDPVFASRVEAPDYLVYLKGQQFMFYDPISNESTEILPGWNVSEFSLDINNRLAIAASHEGASGIFVLEYPFQENTPVEIVSDTATANNSPISWSPDGHYLLIDSIQSDKKKLLLWDGKHFDNIYGYSGQINGATWSTDGQLAFTEFVLNDPLPDKDPGEVYLWDGNTTVSVSQNPTGEDRFPAWSKGGQLAFLSNRNGEYDIYIWDGVSKDHGVPDITTYDNIASHLTYYYSKPVWTNIDTLAFSASDDWDLNIQVYEWNGQTTKNISENPFSHNGGQTWRNDGYWAFITFFSDSQDLYVRDETNRTVLKTKGQYRPAWSQNGFLAFCVPNDSVGWALSLWNGATVVEIAQGGGIYAKWDTGEYVFCSSG